MTKLSFCKIPESHISASTFDQGLYQILSDFGSSDGCAISDDRLKDADNAAWLVFLTPKAQKTWRERIHWIRIVDRLAEQDWLRGNLDRFEQFRRHWQHLRKTGEILIDSPCQRELWQMSRAWGFYTGSGQPDSGQPDSGQHQNEACDHFAVFAWQRYLDAIADYHQDDLILPTMADYDQMLDRLGGSLFQVFPDLNTDLAVGARALGSLDQCYNHLRDLYEDTQHGLCYFPQDLLDGFGLSAEDFYTLRVFDRPGYLDLMRFWLREYLPPRVAIAQRFSRRLDLPPAWRLLCDWSLDRYRRIEACLQRCNYDYGEFSERYWTEARQHLKYYPDRLVFTADRSVSNHCEQYCARIL